MRDARTEATRKSKDETIERLKQALSDAGKMHAKSMIRTERRLTEYRRWVNVACALLATGAENGGGWTTCELAAAKELVRDRPDLGEK